MNPSSDQRWVVQLTTAASVFGQSTTAGLIITVPSVVTRMWRVLRTPTLW